ncbi:MAG: FeoA domain-containing protein [Candidatus Nezhaarchaeota archaeon]|nr:FeoA domain-containing protein [Candidatus Nezhaarchaeota archaeon]MCX8141184.1 FeoA domain-containing protein [Candidatus Nezhaarchaeota archaeon]MDW8049450.1 FeoA domain-containing protein [Nitrososphaerota archaeon]
MSTTDILSCALEIVLVLNRRGVYPDEAMIAKELNEDPHRVKQVLDEAVKNGLVTKRNGLYELTKEGLKSVLKHRELYVHDFFVHRDSRWSKGIVDWSKHWRLRHGLTKAILDNFYDTLADLDGIVEELVPLIELKPGERGIVVSTIGERGVVRRLAEMGLTPGACIEVVRKAPLKGPIEIEVRGTRLAIGSGLASKIAIKKLK